MKKKVLSGVFALAVLVATGYGVNKSMNSNADLSDLALSNVEALANGENPGGKYETFDLIYAPYVFIWDGVIFNCIETGIVCLGTGTLDCTPKSTTHCTRA